MKKAKLLFLFALLLTTVGCDKDDISPNEEIVFEKNILTTITDVSGTIQYDAEWDHWYICVVHANTFDSIINYYPLSISKELCVPDKKVVFSGEVHEIKNTKIGPAGHEYYAIELTSIKTL